MLIFCFSKLSGKRRVTIDNFKGNTMVNIREYYEDKSSGNMLPGKKVCILCALGAYERGYDGI